MKERALVLGGGGAAGNAWVIGVVAGLFDAGLDVTDADLVIGTSSGSTAAAQIFSATRPSELFAAIVGAAAPPTREFGGEQPSQETIARLLDRTSAIITGASDPADMRRRLGAAALAMAATADASSHARRRALVASRLRSQEWPWQRLLIVAVDAQTGEPVLFDRDSGVDLVDAVAASTSGPGAAPYPINGGRYIDGGYRAGENADLAAGYARVLVLSPFGGRSRMPAEWGTHLAAQVDGLRAKGSRVDTVFPDGAAENIFAYGANQMDPSTRPPAARAGYDQGRGLATSLRPLWTG